MSYDYTRPHFEPVPEGWTGTRLEAVVISCEVAFRRDGSTIRNEAHVFVVGPYGALELQGEYWPVREFNETVQAWEAHHAPRCWIPRDFGPAAGQCAADKLPEGVIMRHDVWTSLLTYCEGEGIYTRDVRDCGDLAARRQFVAEVIYTLGQDLDFGEILADDEA